MQLCFFERYLPEKSFEKQFFAIYSKQVKNWYVKSVKIYMIYKINKLIVNPKRYMRKKTNLQVLQKQSLTHKQTSFKKKLKNYYERTTPIETFEMLI